MNVEEVRIARFALESEIHAFLQEKLFAFRARTGLVVAEINIDLRSEPLIGEATPRYVVAGVDAYVPL